MFEPKDFNQFSRVEQKKIRRAFSQLKSLYDKIPSTKGCLENNCKEGGCKSWCCVLQSPQMLYVEFLNTLTYIFREWSLEQISKLVDRSVYNYIDDLPTKGCVFFNKETGLCNCHKTRCYNCRIYGITPYEEFHPRYLKTVESYKGVFGAVVKDQCDLVSTESGKEITTKDTDKWWEILVDIEHSIGVKRDLINDMAGGSYRTPHDHIMFYFLPDNALYNLQNLKISKIATYEEKRIAADEYLIQFHNRLNLLKK